MDSRPLLILDIDETLIHGSSESLDSECAFQAGEFFIYLRPGLSQFLARVSTVYELAVWSSASVDYLKVIVDHLTSNYLCEFKFVWDRRRCIRRFDFEAKEEFFLKDLKKVRQLGFELGQILILEDEPRKVNRHFGNAMYVRPFVGDKSDNELALLSEYLVSIHSESDFRKLEKRNWRAPFGQHAE